MFCLDWFGIHFLSNDLGVSRFVFELKSGNQKPRHIILQQQLVDLIFRRSGLEQLRPISRGILMTLIFQSSFIHYKLEETPRIPRRNLPSRMLSSSHCWAQAGWQAAGPTVWQWPSSLYKHEMALWTLWPNDRPLNAITPTNRPTTVASHIASFVSPRSAGLRPAGSARRCHAKLIILACANDALKRFN